MTNQFDEHILMLYVMRWPDDDTENAGLIKIGSSRDPAVRHAFHFRDAELEAWCPGTEEEEQEIHWRLFPYQAPHFPRNREGHTEIYYPYRAVEAVVADIHERWLRHMHDLALENRSTRR